MNNQGNKLKVAGFISPPHWFDPSPAEFQSICIENVATQQTMMDLYNLFYGKIENIAGTLPEMIASARLLSSADCDVLAHSGSPFGWAGLDSEAGVRDRCKLLADAAGVPVVMAGTAIIDGLRALGVEKVAISTPYYTEDWRQAWSAIVTSSGLNIELIQSMDQQGLVPKMGSVADIGWTMTPDMIVTSAVKIAADAPGAEAVVITGAGARTLALTEEIEQKTGLPVLASDTALYWALAKHLGVSLQAGVLGKLTDA